MRLLPLRGVGSLTFRRICYPPELVPTPVPSPREKPTPSPSRGEGGLINKDGERRGYRIIYPYTPCRRITYPPERVGACPLPPSPREGSVDGWGKYGLRSSLLAFKTKWRKKGQNKSDQGNALGIVSNQHSPRMGKRIIIPLTPFATL